MTGEHVLGKEMLSENSILLEIHRKKLTKDLEDKQNSALRSDKRILMHKVR